MSHNEVKVGYGKLWISIPIVAIIAIVVWAIENRALVIESLIIVLIIIAISLYLHNYFDSPERLIEKVVKPHHPKKA